MLPPDGGFAGADEWGFIAVAGVVDELLGLAAGVDEEEVGALEGGEGAGAEIGEFTFDEDVGIGAGFNDGRSKDSE